MSTINRIFETFKQYNLVKTFLLTLILTVVFLYLLSWPGCLLAAVIGGFFTLRYSRAAIMGFLAGLSAWGILVGIHAAFGGIAVLELFGAIAGLTGMGEILAVIIVLIGGLLGLSGSLLGNAIFALIEPYVSKSGETTK